MEKVILSHIKKLEIFRRVYSLYEIYLLLFFRKNSEGLYLFENLCYQDGTESFGIFLNNLREDLWIYKSILDPREAFYFYKFDKRSGFQKYNLHETYLEFSFYENDIVGYKYIEYKDGSNEAVAVNKKNQFYHSL